MTTLYATVGLPGSGKSTQVRRHVAAEVAAGRRATRVNRDCLRDMLFPGCFAGDNDRTAQEKAVTVAQHAQITALLRAGWDVYVDDTNLRAKNLRILRDFAVTAGADFEVIDFTGVPVEECIRRDASRRMTYPAKCDGSQVGASVIQGMHDRYLAGGRSPIQGLEAAVRAETLPESNPYVPPMGAPAAVMVDLDGTVAHLNGRSPYDETCVSADLPNENVILAVQAASMKGLRIIFMSGRTDGCRADTEAWLIRHVLPRDRWEGLFMRAAGDQRPDNVVKLELFNHHVRNQYDVRFVFDDRNQVVKAWRSIGLTVMQVAEGDF